MRKALTILFAFTVLVLTKGWGQELNGVQKQFEKYAVNTLQEKLYVHINKTTFAAGELLWFKVYNVDGDLLKPLSLSKVVYIEILDNNNAPVLQSKVAMKDGAGNGSLFLPLSLNTGIYTIRAYTSWMKNFEPDYYFTERITVINPLKSPETVNQNTQQTNYEISFFPEGGKLVDGVTSTVGFKVTDDEGRGVAFKGAVINQRNDTVARFAPLKFGMGHFSFKPETNTKYTAVLRINGKDTRRDIPAADKKGYVMNVSENGSAQLTVTVNTNTSDGAVYLFAQTHHVVKVIKAAQITNGSAQFTVDKNKLGDGVSQLTIFNSAKVPVCERLYFKRPTKTLLVNSTTNAPTFASRKKVDIDIATLNNEKNPVSANLSLSVYKLDSLHAKDHINISNYLWLSSDLKGMIESPDYYFENTGAEVNEAIDNLMLTQGWRRFSWDNVLSGKLPAFKFIPELDGPVVTANVTGRVTKQPVGGITAYLGIPGKSVQLYAAKSDSAGQLTFNMKNFYGPAEVVAETNTEIDTNYHIEVATPFSNQYTASYKSHPRINTAVQNLFEDESLSMQVQNIYNAPNLRQFYNAGADSSAFYGSPYKTYLLDNYTRFTTMEEVMREYIREVNIFHISNKFEIKVISGIGFLQEGEPMVLVDGVPFFNINKVFTVDPLKIRKLENVPYPYYLGPSFEDGIFSLTSYKGDFGGVEIDPHAVILDYEGLQLERKFYSPVYDSDAKTTSHLPDFRNTLYWSPSIISDSKGKSSVSFYTSDQQGEYIGVIQGITQNGEFGYSEFRFSVK